MDLEGQGREGDFEVYPPAEWACEPPHLPIRTLRFGLLEAVACPETAPERRIDNMTPDSAPVKSKPADPVRMGACRISQPALRRSAASGRGRSVESGRRRHFVATCR